ncbi:MAG: hypothetical protein KAI47_10270 [Deltaproteobacteria bacterium]|nr:hypothetical protein [Deltaproteobacteria bacterium]
MLNKDNAQHVAVWEAMAEQFLDTERRHDLPFTALRCVEAGLSVSQAREVWRHEVTRAVGFNTWDIAGEWMGWDRDWLIARIEATRPRHGQVPGALANLGYRFRAPLAEGIWRSIARFMTTLLATDSPTNRETLAVDLAALARHAVDFCPDDLSTLDAANVARLRALYPSPFRGLLAPALMSDEIHIAKRRINAALAAATG